MSISAINSGSSTPSTASTRHDDFIKKMFSKLDADGDGKVTQDEFSSAMEKRFGKAGADGDKRPDAATVFKGLDVDGDGAIDVSEFKTGMDKMREQHKGPSAGGAPPSRPSGPPPSAKEEADQVFDALDTNKDGTVSAAELLAAFQKKADSSEDTKSTSNPQKNEALEKLFKALDADDDGRLTKVELTTAIEQMRKNAEAANSSQSAYNVDGSPRDPGTVGDNLSVTV